MDEFGNWGVVGSILLTAGVITLGTWWVTRYTLRAEAEATAAGGKEEIERHATFLAVRVTSILDPFVMKCIDVVNDNGAYDTRGERATTTSDPVLALPQDVDWKSIDPHHMDRVLTLPNEIMNTSGASGERVRSSTTAMSQLRATRLSGITWGWPSYGWRDASMR